MTTTKSDGAGAPGGREDGRDGSCRELVGDARARGDDHGGDEFPGARRFAEAGPGPEWPLNGGDGDPDGLWLDEAVPGAEWPFGHGDEEDGLAGDGDFGDGDGEGWWFGSEWDGEEPPEPRWALDASEQVLRERLAAATTGPAGLDTAGVVEALTPDGTAAEASVGGAGVDPAGLVDGIVATQRLINHYQAVQRQWLAALARPGVAVPLHELVDASLHPGRSAGTRRPLGDLPADLPVDGNGDVDYTPLLCHPAWAAALTDTAARLAAAEVGCALRLAPLTARTRVEDAVTVLDVLPATHGAQHTGDVDGFRAAIIADRTAILTPGQRRHVDRQVAPGAGTRTPGVLRSQVDRAVVAADPAAAQRRAERAKARRGVQVAADADDMAVFRALLHCSDAQLAFGVLDEQARSLAAAGLADGRGVSQLRADVLADLFRTLADTGHAHLTGQPATADNDTTDGSGTNGTDRDRPDGIDTDEESDRAGATDDTHSDGVIDRAGGDHPDDDTAEQTPPEPARTGSSGSTQAASNDDPARAGAGRFSGVEPCRGHCHHTNTRHGPGPGGRAGTVAGHRRATALNVYLTATTLAGWDDQPAELAGHGIITAGTARALAASADTIRALITRPITTSTDHAAADKATSPPGLQGVHSANPVRSRVCGTTLDAGRSVYRPPDPVCDYVQARDRTCTWPGCRAPGRRCDLDHRHPHSAGGATCPCNVDLLCRFHHQVKTFTAWHAQPGPDGQLIWISPTGHRYPTSPAHPLLDPIDGGADPPGRDGPARAGIASTQPAAADPGNDPPPF